MEFSSSAWPTSIPSGALPPLSLIGQAVWASVLTLSGRYDQLYTYVIYGMVLSYTLTVIGMFVLRVETSRNARGPPLHGLPVVARDLCLTGSWWTINTIVDSPEGSFGWNLHRAARGSGVPLLEAQSRKNTCIAREI